MHYPVLIQKDPDSDYGIIVPDLPGCISAGATIDEALEMVKEAIELHIEEMLADGEEVPDPSPIEHHRGDGEYDDGIWAVVDVDAAALMGPAERINITVPKIALVKIDRAAAASGINRSQFLVRSALAVSRGARASDPADNLIHSRSGKPKSRKKSQGAEI